MSGQEVKDNLNDTVDEAKLLPRLSGLLELDSLWETLSQCLLELGHTPDHHAVLVLQVNLLTNNVALYPYKVQFEEIYPLTTIFCLL